MATPYEKIYKRFLNSITDFNIGEFDDNTVNEMLQGWLESAIVNVRTSTNLSARDDEIEEFESDLTDLDVELLAKGMTLAWLDQTLNSTELTMMFVSGKEEKLRRSSPTVRCIRKLCSASL